MANKQIAFVAELKTQLGLQGCSTVKEWTFNTPITLTENYEVIIYATNEGSSGERAEVTEASNFQVIICIKKTELNGTNNETIKQNNIEKVKKAIFNTFDGAIAYITSYFFADGVNQEITLTEFNNVDYIAYNIPIQITVKNSYV